MASFLTALFQQSRVRRGAVLGLFGVAAMCFGSPSSARPPEDGWAYGYSVTLEDDQGNALRTFHEDGTTFVLGYEGEHYEVRLSNHTDRRVEAVVSIDGRDAISGNPGDYAHERGYIVPPHGSVRVDGFRRSLDETAAFRFSAPSRSYSSRMGTPENVGVIGVAFFPERRVVQPRPPVRPLIDEFRDERPEPDHSPWWSSRSRPGLGTGGAEKRSAPAPAASAPAASTPPPAKSAARESAHGYGGGSPSQRDSYRGADDEGAPSRLGTEYGEASYSPVKEVSFVRADAAHPAVLLSLRYDDADGLLARGIDVYPQRREQRERPWWSEFDSSYQSGPVAFPRNRFAPPPP